MKGLKLLLAGAIVFAVGCKREYDNPPVNTIAEGSQLTIADLKAIYNGQDSTFTTDLSVYATVTADEESGNLYKSVFVRDNTGSINLILASSGGLYEGDSIRINLNGTTLSEYNGMIQVADVDVDENVVKQSTDGNANPVDMTIAEVSTDNQSQLIRLTDVMFVNTELSQTYADAVNLFSENRTLTDCDGNEILVRTSGYSSFADIQVAQGKGTLVGVVGVYGSDLQIYIRSLDEVNMDGERCAEPYLMKDFEDGDILSGGWSMANVTGNVNWTANDQFANSGDWYGQITNYSNSTNTACESWLFTPSIDLTDGEAPYLNFINASNYTGDDLEVYVSSDYQGNGDVASATWTQLNATLSTGNWDWVNSGGLDLSAFNGQSSVYIGFKYTGSASDGKTWEIDDVIIDEL